MTKREENFERMLEAVKTSYSDAVQKMEALKQQGKTKSATYYQLMSNKMTYQNMLSLYKLYDLLEDEQGSGKEEI